MADADFDEFDAYRAHRPASAGQGGRMQRWMNGAGAVTSVALIAGLGLWAYNLAVRDVRGVPVIQALEGPARVAPDDPGGELAVHQGMAVNEIAADGTAGDPADRLTLAPRPDGLAEEDQPMGELAASAEDSVPPTLLPLTAPGSDFTEAPVADAPGVEAPVLAALRPDEPLPDGPVEGVPLDAGIEEPRASAEAISADIPGVSASLRPAARPASDVDIDAMAEAAAAAVAAALAPQSLDVAPDTLAEGTRLVQIGAYPDEARARLEWDKASARFGALLDGKRRVIEAATSGGQTFYRLRVEGFSDLDDARRFCAALKADNAECVPAVVR
ncbi:SPOR domain-containing protein [Defluviimonas sp. SAOS-178_SWC]|uniref:SPOR domain-containing protein n=1 Tax=Defluviimonas sp. SAOS-178_SWC TaxID=3121287 RepID=UPI0032215532